MQEEPEALKQAIELRVPLALRWAEEMAALDVPSIWIGEGLASSSLISSRQYAEFALPYQQRLTARLRELGVPSVLHICGKADGILEAIASSGVDCFEADWQVELAEAKTRIGNRVALKGNLHTTRLVQSSPDEIYREACRAIESAMAGGGFILSSGCALGRDTTPANVDAMVRAARDVGTYLT
jgi:uroporphyrinogen decarboxylase